MVIKVGDFVHLKYKEVKILKYIVKTNKFVMSTDPYAPPRDSKGGAYMTNNIILDARWAPLGAYREYHWHIPEAYSNKGVHIEGTQYQLFGEKATITLDIDFENNGFYTIHKTITSPTKQNSSTKKAHWTTKPVQEASNFVGQIFKGEEFVGKVLRILVKPRKPNRSKHKLTYYGGMDVNASVASRARAVIVDETSYQFQIPLQYLKISEDE